MRSTIAMRADVDNESARLDVDLVGAEIDEHVDCIRFRHRQRVEPAFARDEAEIEAADARGGAVQHIEAVPPILHHAKRQRRLRRERENGAAIGPREGPGSKNEHRLDFVRRRMVGEGGERFRPGAEVVVFVGEVGHFADEPGQHAAPEPALTNARVEHRRFVARIRTDDEDRVGLVDSRDRRIEDVGRAAEFRMELRTILATVDVGRAEPGEQRLQREHFLDRRQIADDCADPGRRCRLDLASDRGESLRPARRLERASDTHVRAVEPLRLEPVDDVPRLVGNPFLVDRIVDARQDAYDLTSARIETDRRAQRIHNVDRLGLDVLPRAGVERGRFRGQGSNRTEVDNVTLQLRRQRLLEIGGDLHVLAAADRAEFRDAGDFGHKADAARALDAAVHRGFDQGANELVVDGALVLGEAR